jgi:hypothetical protein
MINAPQVQLQAIAKYPLSKAPISDFMSRHKELLGKISNLNYMDHNITDAHKFSVLAWDQYLCATTAQEIGAILLEPQQWVTRLDREGILNVLDIPHFRQST